MALANARRISGDNADIAMKALGELAVAQERLRDLVEAAQLPLAGSKRFGNALDAAIKHLEGEAK